MALRVCQVVGIVCRVTGVRRRRWGRCLVTQVVLVRMLVGVLVLTLLVAVRMLVVLSLVRRRVGVLVVPVARGMAVALLCVCVALSVALQVRVGTQASAELLVAVTAQSFAELHVVWGAP